jgi:hypothetical protein
MSFVAFFFLVKRLPAYYGLDYANSYEYTNWLIKHIPVDGDSRGPLSGLQGNKAGAITSEDAFGPYYRSPFLDVQANRPRFSRLMSAGLLEKLTTAVTKAVYSSWTGSLCLTIVALTGPSRQRTRLVPLPLPRYFSIGGSRWARRAFQYSVSGVLSKIV